MTVEQVVASLDNFDLEELRVIEDAMKVVRGSMQPRTYRRGQTILVKWDDGKRYHMILTGGRSKANAWCPCDNKDWRFPWSWIIDWNAGPIAPMYAGGKYITAEAQAQLHKQYEDEYFNGAK